MKNFLFSNSSTNYSSGGTYKSQSRGYYATPSVYTKNPVVALKPISMAMPSFRGGCGGIDMFAGSFSHINAGINSLHLWKQYHQMLWVMHSENAWSKYVLCKDVFTQLGDGIKWIGEQQNIDKITKDRLALWGVFFRFWIWYKQPLSAWHYWCFQ